jgi:hypothetical protein
MFSISHGPPLGSMEKDCLHTSIRWSYELKTNSRSSVVCVPRPVYSNGNYDLFNAKILQCRDSLPNDDADASYNLLFSAASSLDIPTRMCKDQLRANPKGFKPSIKALTKEKFKLYCRCRSAPCNAGLKASYIQSCKLVKTAVRKAICKFEASIVRSYKLQPKLLYNYINRGDRLPAY